MIDGMFVVDAIVHPYDFSPANVQDNPVAQSTHEFIYDTARNWMGDDHIVSKELALTDWSADLLSETIFRETATDMAATHRLTLNSWFKDGLVSEAKNVEMAQRWPQRYFTYVGVDPTQGLEECVADMHRQLQDNPHAIGLKLYPHQIYPFRAWRMDDPSLAYPLFREAVDAGVKVVAIHKALPLGAVPLAPYRVDDVDGAAMEFPELKFEIIHSGLAFTEETALAIGRFPNVYANLEVTTHLLARHPRRFGEALAEMLAAAPTRVMWAATLPMLDCQWLLERFVNYEFPTDVVERFGIELTRELKERVLGLNYLEMVGADVEEMKAAIADDEYSAHNDGTNLNPFGTAWQNQATVASQ